jgi:hypothetical protein
LTTTFRIDSNLFSKAFESRRLQDDAFGLWKEMVGKRIVALSSSCVFDPTVLREDVQDWFAQYDAKYRLSMRFAYKGGTESPNEDWGGMECITEIDIFDEEVALLFKLTWVGL